ncbi:energy transducer TonB [Tardiphaga alba]|uniref:Energy transducer TonB n=1 Tax=Tardiphaga alba TaxID=340268 RepID=A0ABX8A832_9BRAD|nr:STN domain-containing protein [Tardiphaga alba]QUS38445.1 energy transducer TonB [Tardiphaga alba]
MQAVVRRPMRGRDFSRWCQAALKIAVLLSIMSAALASAIRASDDARDFAPMQFNIPGQPLASALQTYSRVTGVQLLYESGATNDRDAPAITGEMTRDAALRLLIADTGLMIRYTRANSITLVPAIADPDAPPMAVFDQADLALDTLLVRKQRPTTDASQLRAYSGVIQADIQQALRKESKTRNGVYSAGIKLWIDGPRTIRRTELFRSSGDHERDDAIGRLLDGLQVSQAPPAHTPQPVMVMITVR